MSRPIVLTFAFVILWCPLTQAAPVEAPATTPREEELGEKEADPKTETSPPRNALPKDSSESPPVGILSPPAQHSAESAKSETGPPPSMTLRDEARQIQDELLLTRARIALIGSKIFDSAIEIELRGNLERFYRVEGLTVTLDGIPVYHRIEGLGPQREMIVKVFAVPGGHRLAIRADLQAKRDETYHIHFDQSYTIVVPEHSTVRTRLKLRETGNIFSRFGRKNRGHYHLDVRLNIRSRESKSKTHAEGIAIP